MRCGPPPAAGLAADALTSGRWMSPGRCCRGGVDHDADAHGGFAEVVAAGVRDAAHEEPVAGPRQDFGVFQDGWRP